ncbi:MAG TPA: DUF503 domain-containing protein [Pseudogracilibacillus sp.]|nr:DUF503 domain-containing protein [Pseudogracilibacillus sp.]
MIIYAEVECKLYEGHSLKQKRSVLKRLISKIQKEYNVSITELDYQNLWQRTKLGIAIVSNEYVHAEKMMQKVFETIDSFPELERTLTDIERL